MAWGSPGALLKFPWLLEDRDKKGPTLVLYFPCCPSIPYKWLMATSLSPYPFKAEQTKSYTPCRGAQGAQDAQGRAEGQGRTEDNSVFLQARYRLFLVGQQRWRQPNQPRAVSTLRVSHHWVTQGGSVACAMRKGHSDLSPNCSVDFSSGLDQGCGS